MLQHIAENCASMEMVQFINCDEQGCELVEGLRENDGSWSFNGIGAADQLHGTNSRMVMMGMDDGE